MNKYRITTETREAGAIGLFQKSLFVGLAGDTVEALNDASAFFHSKGLETRFPVRVEIWRGNDWHTLPNPQNVPDVHYQESQAQKRYRLKSSADHYSGALCGNGSAHAQGTRNLEAVTCPVCIARLSRNGTPQHPTGETA